VLKPGNGKEISAASIKIKRIYVVTAYPFVAACLIKNQAFSMHTNALIITRCRNINFFKTSYRMNKPGFA